MQTADLVLGILEQASRKNSNYESDRLYRNFFNVDFYLNAYARTYAKEGNMTPGTDGKTIDGFSIESVQKVIDCMRQERYYFKPARRTYIPKKRGGKRPLGIPATMDKLVQEIARSILESIYEPQFSRNSHGFRPNHSCHTALKQIKREWTGVKWVIEGDIKGFFDNIDHDVLIGIMKRKVKDGRFVELIYRMLKAGYMEDWVYYKTYSGTPQGGTVSPLLANIYLDQLDKFVEEVIVPKYETNASKRRYNPPYYKIGASIAKLTKKIDQLEKGNKEREELIKQIKSLKLSRRGLKTLDPMDENFVRIK